MAEGTSLLRMHTAYTCIVGSNPTLSARTKKNGLPCGRPFFLVRTETVGFEDSRVLARGSPNRPFSAAVRRGARGACLREDCPIRKRLLRQYSAREVCLHD